MKKKIKILLATDYSEAVMNAERYALQFALSTNANLSMVHVYEKLHISSAITNPFERAKLKTDYENHELVKLTQHRDKLYRTLNVNEDELKCACVVREGNAGKELTEEAKEFGADIIIAGTHGASGFRKVFFGTHAWELIKKSDIPVLVIPKDGLFTEIKSIVFASEQREGEIPAIHFVTEFAKQFDANVTVLHIINSDISEQLEEDVFERFTNDVKERITYPKLNLQFAYYDSIINGLNDFCLTTKADLLVMSPKKPSLMENIFVPVASVTKEMSFNTHVPLMAIPNYYHAKHSLVTELVDLNETL